jgi:hypothetical protein
MPQASKPAMFSGPGALSQRTDGGPASQQAIRYAAGEPGAEDFVNLQRQAPMAKTADVKRMAPSQIAQAATQGPQQPAQQQMQNPVQAIPLSAPSQYPTQPVTHGADAGPGAGSESLILPNQVQAQYQDASAMFKQMAAAPDATPALKYLAMRIGQGF